MLDSNNELGFCGIGDGDLALGWGLLAFDLDNLALGVNNLALGGIYLAFGRDNLALAGFRGYFL